MMKAKKMMLATVTVLSLATLSNNFYGNPPVFAEEAGSSQSVSSSMVTDTVDSSTPSSFTNATQTETNEHLIAFPADFVGTWVPVSDGQVHENVPTYVTFSNSGTYTAYYPNGQLVSKSISSLRQIDASTYIIAEGDGTGLVSGRGGWIPEGNTIEEGFIYDGTQLIYANWYGPTHQIDYSQPIYSVFTTFVRSQTPSSDEKQETSTAVSTDNSEEKSNNNQGSQESNSQTTSSTTQTKPRKTLPLTGENISFLTTLGVAILGIACCVLYRFKSQK